MRHSLCLVLLLFSLLPTISYAETERAIPQNQEQIQLSFAPVVKSSAPAVINIYTKRVIEGRAAHPFAGHPFFAPFFNDYMMSPPLRRRVESSLGSGFIIRPDGLAVTNAHVIKGASEIYAVLNDGREYQAQVELVDSASDIALLKLDLPEDEILHALSLDPSESVLVGDIVLAIGNPFGVGQSVTSGIVSALARSSTNISDYDFFIQTDAAINPGNSGGPLINLQGRVVGLNTAIYSRSGGSLGIGFSIPSEMIDAIVHSYEAGARGKEGIIRPWSGFLGQAVTSEMAASLGFKRPQGVLVADIHENSPAAAAGLQQGDLITSLNNKNITNIGELNFRMATFAPETEITLGVLRQNKNKNISFKLIAPPEIPARDLRKLSGKHPFNGASIVNLSPAVIQQMSLGDHGLKGVAISDIAAHSVSERLGFKTGDIILQINEEDVKSSAQMEKLLQDLSPSSLWKIIIQRDGVARSLIFR